MRNFLAVLCVSLLLFNSVAVAGGLSRGLGWSKKPIEMLRGLGGGKLAELSGRAKQLGAGLLLAGLVTCNMTACNSDEVTHTLEQEKSRVATLDYQHSASLDEIIAALEQVEGARVGSITHSEQGRLNEQGLLTVETDNGAVYLQLSEGEVLINKVTLYEEAVDAGWIAIAEGSLIASVPAVLLAGGLLVLAGTTIFAEATLEEIFN